MRATGRPAGKPCGPGPDSAPTLDGTVLGPEERAAVAAGALVLVEEAVA